MALINDLKRLVARSKLFVHQEKLGKNRVEGKRDRVKIGQGGTLDPLADGVLGSFALHGIHVPIT